MIWLSDTTLDTVGNENAIGLPIGYQSSQLYAVLLLNELDHIIKEKLHIKGYGRYVDDFYLIHKDKDYLKYCLGVIREYLKEYGLKLNEKTQIFPIKNGIDFLGFHTYVTDSGKVICKLRKRSKEAMRRRLKKLKADYVNGIISMKEINQSYRSWRAYAAYGDTHHLIQNMNKYYHDLFQCCFAQ